MDEAKQLYAIVHGRVQGVSFRYYTVQTARTLGLTGWVRNLPDSTVEVLAEGPCPPLEQLLAWLHEGSPSAGLNMYTMNGAMLAVNIVIFASVILMINAAAHIPRWQARGHLPVS